MPAGCVVSGTSIPFPLKVIDRGQVLKTVFCHDGLAHGACFHHGEGIAALADLLEPCREQAGVQTLLAIFGDGRPGE